jgi:spore germination cell wall hydrolase CwlJ-like protein
VKAGFQLKAEHHPKDAMAWDRAVMIATNAVKGKYYDITHGATFYHAVYVKPYWAKKKKRVLVVGNHIFYRKDKSLVSYNESINGRNS